ncbi:nucleotide pyrophosphohydrolase [Puniceicoccus vermicola]|uniref:Nucleotide pyrophosphohydrolase n=1 Tax=Puniceicoccus vermicola TaxID=388746 RepID=A0A7X1AWG4_9BACT|nr:nucleotide pyrophosphohydrolase [Puniceicoccus vermicola]MBC2601059.1 nucleotide pyrophosphohydrolase [Puniceicoccus vermicola]
MKDNETRLLEIKERVLAFARERDWEQFHSPKNLSMAIAAESGELLEHFLWMESADSRKIANDPEKIAKIREELADIVIYAIEFANMTDTDLAETIEKKMSHNAAKYPVDKARGRSDKYTEL